jgi:hypothetical protein
MGETSDEQDLGAKAKASAREGRLARRKKGWRASSAKLATEKAGMARRLFWPSV